MNHHEILNDLIRDLDALQAKPFRACKQALQVHPAPARSTVRTWIYQFVNLLVQS